MSVLTRMGDWMLSKTLGTTEAAAAPCEQPRGACSYCDSSGRFVQCSTCYYDVCERRWLRSGCRRTQHVC
ncbi:hypothetical protein [Kribbella sp. CA-293567]|uniref:hypothetical protein n=1 Tax=Kribbella sp. CA-293567 TaxID=3002436 RepID=UPI0022DDA718|nr:hypothetical protein [Kribbella sp. CA-293567]WBQ01973.1 hypothetical protein OX958_18465 [Kribbella sp. CA-293567]